MGASLHGPTMYSRLCYFEAVVRQGSVTAAAAELHLTQSAVSQQLRQLETAVGRPLFRRSGRRLELTDTGRMLHDGIADPMHSVAAAYRNVVQSRDPNAINVDCAPSIANQLILPQFADFLARHPDIRVRIHGAYDTIDAEKALTQEIDVAIRWEPEQAGRLEQIVLAEEVLFPVCSPAVRDSLDLSEPEDLSRAILLYDQVPWDGADPLVEWRCWLAQAGAEHLLDRLDGMAFNLMHMAIQSAVAGHGVAIVRGKMVARELQDGQLIRPFPMAVAAPARYVAYLPHRTAGASVRKFLDWLGVSLRA